eukprot:5019905-Amphidinium_carterae.1
MQKSFSVAGEFELWGRIRGIAAATCFGVLWRRSLGFACMRSIEKSKTCIALQPQPAATWFII